MLLFTVLLLSGYTFESIGFVLYTIYMSNEVNDCWDWFIWTYNWHKYL